MPRDASKCSADPPPADLPVRFIRGIGEKRGLQFEAHGIRTLMELVAYAPFRYEDRCSFVPIAALRDEQQALIMGRICSAGGFQSRRRGLAIFEILIKDETGSVCAKFFNQPYLRNVYREGLTLIAYGQVKRDSYSGGRLCLQNPECEIADEASGPSIHSGRVVPIYRRLGDLRTRTLRQILSEAVALFRRGSVDPLPEYLRRELHLMERGEAIAQVHFPVLTSVRAEDRAHEMDRLNQGLSGAHKRMIFEELFFLQVGLRLAREHRRGVEKPWSIRLGDRERAAIKRVLPFHPTLAQKRVLREIADDMRSSRPMSRLLQGDVGSGKTIVAAQASIIAVENGFQAAIMAPTEILAEQHFLYFRRLLEPLGYTIDLLTGNLRKAQRAEVLARVESGAARIVVGTHALIQEGVSFHKLALAVVDEQHRFGVVQRNALKSKGARPDMLVMTATPIPRSLALTLYGDLDVSVIDELPPGRKPVETLRLEESRRDEVTRRIRAAVDAGGQAYVVYPLVEESEKVDLKAATAMAAHLADHVFPDLRIGLLHGRMKSAEKEQVMALFTAGQLDVLVSTTVIEVGVDVPNASVMVIEHAERFGLAQLHQLRGRVGRGAAKSTCILVAEPDSPEARRRLDIMCETNDGFRIAEVDLELRGPGEIAGTRQSGVPVFTYADIVRDKRALDVARREADRFVAMAQSAPDKETKRVLAVVRKQWKDRFRLALVG